MALTEAQMQAMQDAEDIDTGVDTRTKEEMLAEQMSDLQSVGKAVKEEGPMFIAESTPGVGEAIAMKRTSDALDEGDYVGAGIEATAGVLGLVPVIGDAASKGLRQVAQSVRKGYNPEDPASRVFHLTKKDFDAADVVGKGTNDIGFHVGTAAQATSRGSTNIKYDKELAEQMVKDERILPMVLKNTLKPARIIDVGSFKEPKNWIANLSVSNKDKQLLKFLSDDPADADLLGKAPRVTVGGDTYFMLPDAMRSGIDEKLWKDIILEAHRARRVGLDTINKQEDRVEWFNTLKQTANKNGYDSFVYRNEYEGKSFKTPSVEDDSYMLLEPDQAKGLFGGMTEGDPRYMKNEGGLMLQKGGVIPMDRQMSMFDEGGLEDDGGTVDPVSGNDVPPGSSKAEVRDDIPAQLSEGEFVFPADVVRYIGLEKLMMMRQQAKMGLKMMDEMGQMGNSEEATIPDDLPFSMMDLIIVDNEDEEEYNDKKEEKEMAEGGVVYAANGTSVPAADPTSGIFFQPSQFAGQGNRPGVAQAAPDAASRQFVQQPQQSTTPTVKYEKPQATFGEFLEPPQGGPQTITIVNSETGEKRQITFIPGVTEIPTGFVREEDYVPKEIVPEQETTRVETARVAPETGGNNEERQRREEEMYGLGGARVGVDGKIYGVSFDMPEGFMPGMGASISTSLSLATGEPLPEGVTVNFKRGQVEFSMTSEEYNDFKSTARKFGYNSKEASEKLNELGREEAEKEAKIAEQIENARRVEDNMARAAQKIKDEKEREAALLEVAKRREDRSVYGTGGDDTGTKGQGYSVGSQTDKGSNVTPGGFGGTGRGRSDAPGMAAADVRSGSNYGTSPPEGPMGSISGRPRAKGGLMETPKPKAKKKMKRGGLASKK